MYMQNTLAGQGCGKVYLNRDCLTYVYTVYKKLSHSLLTDDIIVTITYSIPVPHSFYETTTRKAAYTHILAWFDIMPAEKYHTTEVICE